MFFSKTAPNCQNSETTKPPVSSVQVDPPEPKTASKTAPPSLETIWTDPALETVDLKLFGWLCSIDGGREADCYASRKNLAMRTGLSLWTLNHSIPRLVRAGYLHIQHRRRTHAMIQVDPQKRRRSGFSPGWTAQDHKFKLCARSASLDPGHDKEHVQPVNTTALPHGHDHVRPSGLVPAEPVCGGAEPVSVGEALAPRPPESVTVEAPPIIALIAADPEFSPAVAQARAERHPPEDIRKAIRHAQTYAWPVRSKAALICWALDRLERGWEIPPRGRPRPGGGTRSTQGPSRARPVPRSAPPPTSDRGGEVDRGPVATEGPEFRAVEVATRRTHAIPKGDPMRPRRGEPLPARTPPEKTFAEMVAEFKAQGFGKGGT